MESGLRIAALWDRVRASLWFWPSLAILAAVVGGELLTRVEPVEQVAGLARFGGTPEGARTILSTVAGSTITVTGLTFSLTVVALQVASSQFTPRLLGSFLADRGNQAVLSVFLGTFAYTIVVLRRVRSPVGDDPGYVPDLAVGVGLLLTLGSVAMLVYFFHHLTQQLRLETVLAELRHDTLAAVHRTEASEDRDPVDPEEVPGVPEHGFVVRARRSGYLTAVRLDAMRRVAERHGVVVRLAPSVGVHVTAGTTLAWAWAVDPQDADQAVDVDAVVHAVHGAIHLGPERSLTEDVAFGIRQLVDIAARALSPGVNDPTSAVAAIDAMAVVLCELARVPAESPVRRDEQGRVRAAVPQSTFPELLALACDQPRRYGRGEPALLTALLRMLADVAEVARTDAQVDAVRTQIDITVDRAREAELSRAERAWVERVAGQARAVCRHGQRRAELEPEDDEEPAT